MGTPLINSASDKKYGELKRLLINSMTQGNNRYLNSKAAEYTMFCEHFHERIKNKNESTTMRDRSNTGV